MESSSQNKGLANLLLLLAVGGAAFAVARFAGSLAGLVGSVFLGLGVLVAFVSWFQMRLEDREWLEKLELDELARSKGSATLFEGKDAETFPAQQSRLQFEKFFVPGFTIVLFAVQAFAAWWLWQTLPKLAESQAPQNQLVALGVFGLFFLALFLFGKYSAGIARLESRRLLAPGAGWLLLGAYLCFLVTAGIAAEAAGAKKIDFYVARGLAGLLALLAAETLFALIFEMYRPRVKGKVARPLYDSRLVGLLAHPEGLFTTAAQTLDYQFGFKVSETWIYSMVVEKLPGFLLGLVVAALLSSCIVFLEPGEQALLERFGRSVTSHAPLGPGAHLKLPWPIDKIYRFNVGEVKTFNVGFTIDPKLAEQKTVLWTTAHYKEELPFLVASRDQQSAATDTQSGGQQSVPVSLLDAGIPVHFRIADVRAWAYGHADAQALLEQLATREVVRYLAGVDLLDIMSTGRAQAAEALTQKIQARANELNLGVEILFVGLQDIHPPTTVAADFEAVNGAAQEVQAKVLAAEGATNRIVLLAQAEGVEKIRAAEGAAIRATTSAAAQGARFANQVAAYNVAPEVYSSRLYLQTVAKAAAGTRKYLIGPTDTHNVFQIDLQDKLRADLLDVNIEPPKK